MQPAETLSLINHEQEMHALQELATQRLIPNQPIGKPSAKEDEQTQVLKVAMATENVEEEANEMARLRAVANEMGEDRLGASILSYPILI